jgi:hypothetical protein
VSESFALDWLRLRESADLAARDPGMARRFAAALPQTRPVRIIDLAAGSGANTRALLPRIAGDQHWTLIDRDRALLAAQVEEFTAWARRQGYRINAGGGRIAVDAQPARWQIDVMPLDLDRDLAVLAEVPADAITAAAFFDLVSPEWLERFVAALAQRRVPLLAALTVDGRRLWQPCLDDDAVIAEGFARHQQRDKGFGAALGGAAPAALERLLTGAGFRVERAPSDWRLDGRNAALLSALIAGEAGAARGAMAQAAARIEHWETERREQLTRRHLELVIGHCDLLALPA